MELLIRIAKVIGVIALVTVATAAIVVAKKEYDTRQSKTKQQIEQIRLESETKQRQQKDQYELKIKNLETQLQAKLAKKARLAAIEAAKTAEKAKLAQVLATAAKAAETPQNASDNYSLVTKWANHYGIDPGWLHRVVKCESGYRSDAVNGNYWAGGSTPTGIAQFLASTYIANAKRIGLPAQDDRLNPDRSLQVMAYMFSIGQWTQWECR